MQDRRPEADDRLLDYDDDVYEEDWEPEADQDTLPARPRRRLVTPVTTALAAVLVAALGFIGGVQVQKHEGGSSAANAATSTGFAAARGGGGGAAASGGGAGGGFPGRAGAGGPQGANATVGSVANKHGNTLYVKDSDGNTERVKTTSHSKINRTATTSAGAIHPGDTVIVQGTKSSSGTITATQINATASGATSGLAGLFGGSGGFGGGQAGQGAAPQTQGSGG
jgi:hypothetical protein